MGHVTVERRLTAAHLPDDKYTRRYLGVEKILYVLLFLSLCLGLGIISIAAYCRSHNNDLLKHHLAKGEKVKTIRKNDIYRHLVLVLSREHHSLKDMYIGRWPNLLSSFVYTVCFMILGSSVAGLLSALQKNIVFVVVFIMFNFAGMFGELLVILLLTSTATRFHEGIKNEMVFLVKSQYLPDRIDSLSLIFNSIMVEGECCGIRGPEDFRPNVKVPDGSHTVMKYPAACCKLPFFNSSANHRGLEKQYMNCIQKKQMSLDHINTKGCFDVWSQRFIRNIAHYIEVITGVLLVMHILMICIGMIILRIASFSLNARPTGSEVDVTGFAKSFSDFHLFT